MGGHALVRCPALPLYRGDTVVHRRALRVLQRLYHHRVVGHPASRRAAALHPGLPCLDPMGRGTGTAALCRGPAATARSRGRKPIRGRILRHPATQTPPSAGPERDTHVDHLRTPHRHPVGAAYGTRCGTGRRILHSLQHRLHRRVHHPQRGHHRPRGASHLHRHRVHVLQRCQRGYPLPTFHLAVATSVARRRAAHLHPALRLFRSTMHHCLLPRRQRLQ